MNYLEIDTTQLNSDIGELNRNISNAKASLRALQEEMDEMNTMWQGEANRVFSAQVAKDCNFMNTLLNKMDKLSDCMTHADREYIKCERAVKSAVANIRI